MTEHILIGHFLLRSEAARRAGISTEDVVQRPDLLRIGGTWLEEVYFEFQFDEVGIRHDLGSTVQLLRRSFDDLAIAEWLACPNQALGGATPLRLLVVGGRGAQMARSTADVDLRGTVGQGR